ncbi:MAG TPA: HlyD family efflux transporter periplasmic adaptor subunit [Candidatus Polarisedimenticolia bacterium]|nr:HlyD family efflux transporter periplasmic adaptor subunit [Candidatus Polarisedimenticolia bacterium]
MPETPPPNTMADEPRTGAGTVIDIDAALWKQLQEAATTEKFAAAWLALQLQLIGGASAGLVVLKKPETGAFAPVAATGDLARQDLLPVLERALRERKGVVARAGDAAGESVRLAYPVWAASKVHGAAALQISARPQHQLQAAMRQLQWGVAWLQAWVLRQSAEPDAHIGRHLKTALDLAALALEEDRFQAAATAVVTELATRLECDRVSIGFLKRRQVKVAALSHSAQFRKQMNLIRSIGTAMAESVDQQAILVYPEPEEQGSHVLYAHEQLARDHGDRSICTVPFIDARGRAYGALTLERSGPEAFDRQAVELSDSMAALLGPILEEKRRNDRLLLFKAGDSLWTQLTRLTGPRYAVRKLIAGALVLLVLFFAFARGQFRVTAESTLEGEVRRAVTAPYRGFIAEAPARAGDLVRSGQTLCSMDVRDLRVEQAKWASQREQFLLEQRKSMADGQVAAMRVLGKKMDQAAAELALLEEQIARARITAPFDAVVVNGDLSQALGAPVDAGQVLYELAPLDSYRLMLRVDERDVSHVSPDQKGTLILTSLPESRFRFTVRKVTPVSIIDEGRNYFLAEATLDEPNQRLRPGMEGFGKVEIDRRLLIWIWTHDLIDWARLWVWSWWP